MKRVACWFWKWYAPNLLILSEASGSSLVARQNSLSPSQQEGTVIDESSSRTLGSHGCSLLVSQTQGRSRRSLSKG
eukprot:11825351-Ditylum_brightwellii.AAC.1